MGIDIRGRTIDIIGVGRIGVRVAQICRSAFGMRTFGFDPNLGDNDIIERGAEPRALESLLSESDFVTLHAPSTQGTHHLLGATAIATMKPGAFLINTRGVRSSSSSAQTGSAAFARSTAAVAGAWAAEHGHQTGARSLSRGVA